MRSAAHRKLIGQRFNGDQDSNQATPDRRMRRKVSRRESPRVDGAGLALLSGIVDQATDLAAEIMSVDHAVNESALKKEFGPLETFG